MQLHRMFIDSNQLRIEGRLFLWNGHLNRYVFGRWGWRWGWCLYRCRGTWRWRITIRFAVFTGGRWRSWQTHTFVNETHHSGSIVVSRTNGRWNSRTRTSLVLPMIIDITYRRKKLLIRCSTATSDICGLSLSNWRVFCLEENERHVLILFDRLRCQRPTQERLRFHLHWARHRRVNDGNPDVDCADIAE